MQAGAPNRRTILAAALCLAAFLALLALLSPPSGGQHHAREEGPITGGLLFNGACSPAGGGGLLCSAAIDTGGAMVEVAGILLEPLWGSGGWRLNLSLEYPLLLEGHALLTIEAAGGSAEARLWAGLSSAAASGRAAAPPPPPSPGSAGRVAGFNASLEPGSLAAAEVPPGLANGTGYATVEVKGGAGVTVKLFAGQDSMVYSYYGPRPSSLVVPLPGGLPEPYTKLVAGPLRGEANVSISFHRAPAVRVTLLAPDGSHVADMLLPLVPGPGGGP